MIEQALSGFKVLDLGQYIAGPYAAMLLAEQGAEVIKVERPEGDPSRSDPGFLVWNRSKKCIRLDLKKDKGRQIAIELAKDADVIIENFRPEG
jgi:formyl-CoA transferase